MASLLVFLICKWCVYPIKEDYKIEEIKLPDFKSSTKLYSITITLSKIGKEEKTIRTQRKDEASALRESSRLKYLMQIFIEGYFLLFSILCSLAEIVIS